MNPADEPPFEETPYSEPRMDEPYPADVDMGGLPYGGTNGGPLDGGYGASSATSFGSSAGLDPSGSDDSSLIKMLPSNINAEQAVLGSLLIDPDAIIKIANFLRPEDFYRERHGWLYAAMLALNERREPLDMVTVTDELQRREQLDEIGGPAYLNDLYSSTPTSINVDFYARIVERTALLRRLIAAAGKIAELAYDESQDSDQVIERAEQIIFGISESRIHRDLQPIHSIMQDVVNHLDFMSRHQDQLMGVPTGFRDLDQMLGGFQQSDLIILAARPAMGKSSFALSVALTAAKNTRSRIAIFSLEMSNDQMVQRLLAMETRIDSHRLRLGQVHEEEWDIVLTVANSLANTSIYIDDTPGATVNDIRTKSRRLYAEQGLDMIMIDYMQLMSAQQAAGRGENRQQEISYISRSLKGLARELNVPVLALSQLSRAVESRADKRPMMSDLRESGCLTGDTLVYLPDLGRYVPIEELVGQTNVRITALNFNTMKLETCEASKIFSTGKKQVYRLTTQLGRTIRATANHKFYTFDGWKRLDELEPSQHVAIPRVLPGGERPTLSEGELALLGHLIGDGCVLPRHAVQYTTRELDIAEYVVQLATDVFGSQLKPRLQKERTWFQVYLSASEHLTHGKRNPVSAWFEEMGIFGLRSHEKHVPARVFEQPSEAVAVFLRHLWATDGCIRMTWGKSPRPAVYYATSSRVLATDVQSLLLRFGINARVRHVPQGSKGRTQYHVIVGGKKDIDTFIAHIGAFGAYKQESLSEIQRWIDERIHNTNRDVIPSHIWRRYVVPAMQEQGITTRQLQRDLGHAYCGTTLYKQNVSRERAARLADIVASSEVARLASSDIYWDRIVSIEPDGIEDAFDITVPKHHNFVADNMIVHNSIEQDADVVMFIYREDYYIPDTDRQNIADIIVAKHRHGSTGTVNLYFRKELTQFSDMEIERTDLDY